MGLKNDLVTIIVFHSLLLLIKEHTSQQIEYSNRLILIEFNDLTLFSTILK